MRKNLRKLLGLILLLPGSLALAQIQIGGGGSGGGVTSINSTTGAMTFTGSGVSQSGTTFTFTGGGVSSINGITGPFTFTGSGVSCSATTCTFNGAAVTSISNSDGTLTFSSPTGSVVGSLALSHANSWTGLQTFSAGLALPGTGSPLILGGNAGTSGQCLGSNGASATPGWIACGSGGGGGITSVGLALPSLFTVTGSPITTSGTLTAAFANATHTQIGFNTGTPSLGSGDTGFGYNTLNVETTSGSFNTALGYQTLIANTTGGSNTAAGSSALGANTTGTNNTGLGQAAADHITSGSNNLAAGTGSLQSDITGSNNTSVGANSLFTNTGSGNVAVGNSAGYNYTGSNAFFVGNVQQSSAANDQNDSLIYGTFAGSAGTTTGNTLQFNAATTVNGALTLGTATGSTQCLQVNSSGVVSGTGAACGSGSGGSTSMSALTAATGSNTITNAANASQIWTGSFNSSATPAYLFSLGESTASTASISTNYAVLNAFTASGSQTIPFMVNQGTLTGNQTTPAAQVNCLWSTTGNVTGCLYINVSSSAAGTSSKALNIVSGASNLLNVDINGNGTFGGTVSATQFISTGSTTGSGNLSLPFNSGTIPALPSNSAGWAGPTASGGTSYLAFMPGTAPSATSLLTFAAAGTTQGVNGTVTSFKSLAGTGAGITSGPTSTTSGDCVKFNDTAGTIADAGAPCGSGGGGSVTWPTTGDVVISNSTSSPAGIAPVNGQCLLGASGAWTTGACGGISGTDGYTLYLNNSGVATTTNKYDAGVNTAVTTTFSAACSSGATTCTITSATGFPTSGRVAMFIAANSTNTNIELADYTLSGTTLTFASRGAHGSTAQSYSSGSQGQVWLVTESDDLSTGFPNHFVAGGVPFNGYNQNAGAAGVMVQYVGNQNSYTQIVGPNNYPILANGAVLGANQRLGTNTGNNFDLITFQDITTGRNGTAFGMGVTGVPAAVTVSTSTMTSLNINLTQGFQLSANIGGSCVIPYSQTGSGGSIQFGVEPTNGIPGTFLYGSVPIDFVAKDDPGAYAATVHTNSGWTNNTVSAITAADAVPDTAQHVVTLDWMLAGSGNNTQLTVYAAATGGSSFTIAGARCWQH